MSFYKPGVFTPEPFYVEGDPEHSDISRKKMLYLSRDVATDGGIRYHIRLKHSTAVGPLFLCLMSAALSAGAYFIRSMFAYESEPVAWYIMTSVMIIFVIAALLAVVAADYTLTGSSRIEASRSSIRIKKTIRGFTFSEKIMPADEISDIRIADRPARSPYRVVEITGAGRKLILGESIYAGAYQEEYLHYLKEKIETAIGRPFT